MRLLQFSGHLHSSPLPVARVLPLVIGLLGWHSGAEAQAIACDPNPTRAVPEFRSFLVTEETGFLQTVGEKCLSPLTEMDASVGKLADLGSANQPGLATATDLAKKGKALRDAVIAIVGGAELYLAQCLTGGAEAYLEQRSPQALVNARQLVKAGQNTREKVETAYAAVQAKADRGESVTSRDLQSIAGFANELVPGAKTVAATRGLWQSALETYERPERLLGLESEVGVTTSRAAALIDDLANTCDLAHASSELQTATQRGQQGLEKARLDQARARKNQRRSEEILDRSFGTAWRRSSAAAAMVSDSPAYDDFGKYTRDLQEAERSAQAFEALLMRAGGLCAPLEKMSLLLAQRSTRYGAMVEQGQNAVASCRMEEATNIIRSLENLEGTACGPFLTTGRLQAPPPDRSGMAGPTSQVGTGATFQAPRQGLPPSVTLRLAQADARDKCAAAEGGVDFSGVYKTATGTVTISGSGSSLLGREEWASGGRNGHQIWQNCTVKGSTATCRWTGVYLGDPDKTAQRRGTLTVTLTGNRLTGSYTEEEPTWDWKVPPYPSAIKAGAVWPLDATRP